MSIETVKCGLYLGDMLSKTTANLSYFLWWRVVCYEAHEEMVYGQSGASEGLNSVVGFQSKHRWYVSGTPFPHGLDSLRAVLQVRLLCCQWCGKK